MNNITLYKISTPLLSPSIQLKFEVIEYPTFLTSQIQNGGSSEVGYQQKAKHESPKAISTSLVNRRSMTAQYSKLNTHYQKPNTKN